MVKVVTCFKGATSFEFQVGPIWLKIIRPRFFRWSNILRVGYDKYWRVCD